MVRGRLGPGLIVLGAAVCSKYRICMLYRVAKELAGYHDVHEKFETCRTTAHGLPGV